jgi:hypothetical protein
MKTHVYCQRCGSPLNAHDRCPKCDTEIDEPEDGDEA